MFSKFVRPIVIPPNREDYLLPQLAHFKACVTANSSKHQLLGKILEGKGTFDDLFFIWFDLVLRLFILVSLLVFRSSIFRFRNFSCDGVLPLEGYCRRSGAISGE
jgi:hypothetical protein